MPILDPIAREGLLSQAQRWADWHGCRPDTRGARRRAVASVIQGAGVGSILGRLQAEGAERARAELRGAVTTRKAPRQFLIDGQMFHVEHWFSHDPVKAWPLWARQAYVAKHGSPFRGQSHAVWASTISGGGQRPSDPVPAGVLDIDQAIACMQRVHQVVLFEHLFGPGKVAERAARLGRSTSSYYRALDRALHHIHCELEGGCR